MNMKICLLLPFIVLFGCASNTVTTKHDVAVSFDSERIAYQVAGQGETTLIFVHGWSCDGRYWHNQLHPFTKSHQVITLDLAGHGHSSSNRSDYLMLSFAKDVKAIIDQEKVNKAILIGHSMGGAIIAEAAKLMPKTVIGIIGVDTLHNVAEDIPPKVIDDMSEPFKDDFERAAKEFVFPMFPENSNQQVVRWITEDMSSAPPTVALSAFQQYLGLYVNGEGAKVFDAITIPVISINAKLWPTLPEENKKHIKDYHLIYIEDSGHFPMLEKPEQFNQLLASAIETIHTKSKAALPSKP